jgi:ATP-binding cassette, subfamily B, multidrug efflux pump
MGDIMKLILQYFAKYKKLFFLAIFFLTIEATVDLLQPTIMSQLVDVGVKNKDLNYITKAGFWMIVITLIGAISANIRNYLASTVSQDFSSDLRLDVYKKVTQLSFKSIDQLETASIVTRLTNDVTQVQQFSYGIMRIVVKAPILAIGAIIMMVLLSPKMALVLGAVLPISILIMVLSMRIGFPFFVKVQRALDHVNTVMREYLAGVRVVKAFNRFKHEQERFDQANADLAHSTAKSMKVIAFFSPGIALTVNLGIATILFIAGYQGTLEVGKIMAFVMYMTQILHALSLMTNIFNLFVRAKASSERISEVLQAEVTEEINQPTPTHYHSIKEGLSFNQVNFSYYGDAGKLALSNINLDVKMNQTVGIIGSTGSGKTTLFNLLVRFYDVTNGSITIDGVDIRDYELKPLRDLIALVPQQNQLFSGSIKDNIAWGKKDATLDEIKACAKGACCDEFIEQLESGYDTILGQGGVNLSGGQKQRICIARALIKQPKILILDDSTSAVDVTTEGKIKQAIKEMHQGMMTFIASSRISSVINCDQIVVLEQGKMVGLGNHQTLMNQCVVYQDIYYSQLGREEC